jgi:hypothetical protein
VVPGDQIATKGDIARLEARFYRLEDIMRDQQKFYVTTLVWVLVGSMTARTGIFAVVVGLLT